MINARGLFFLALLTIALITVLAPGQRRAPQDLAQPLQVANGR